LNEHKARKSLENDLADFKEQNQKNRKFFILETAKGSLAEQLKHFPAKAGGLSAIIEQIDQKKVNENLNSYSAGRHQSAHRYEANSLDFPYFSIKDQASFFPIVAASCYSTDFF